MRRGPRIPRCSREGHAWCNGTSPTLPRVVADFFRAFRPAVIKYTPTKVKQQPRQKKTICVVCRSIVCNRRPDPEGAEPDGVTCDTTVSSERAAQGQFFVKMGAFRASPTPAYIKRSHALEVAVDDAAGGDCADRKADKVGGDDLGGVKVLEGLLEGTDLQHDCDEQQDQHDVKDPVGEHGQKVGRKKLGDGLGCHDCVARWMSVRRVITQRPRAHAPLDQPFRAPRVSASLNCPCTDASINRLY